MSIQTHEVYYASHCLWPKYIYTSHVGRSSARFPLAYYNTRTNAHNINTNIYSSLKRPQNYLLTIL